MTLVRPKPVATRAGDADRGVAAMATKLPLVIQKTSLTRLGDVAISWPERFVGVVCVWVCFGVVVPLALPHQLLHQKKIWKPLGQTLLCVCSSRHLAFDGTCVVDEL